MATYTVIYMTKGYMMLMDFSFPKFRNCGLELSIFKFFSLLCNLMFYIQTCIKLIYCFLI